MVNSTDINFCNLTSELHGNYLFKLKFCPEIDQTGTWCLKLDQFQLPELLWRKHTALIHTEGWLQQCFRKNQTRTTFHSQYLEDFFQNLCQFVHFRSSFIDSFNFAKKRCDTFKVLAPFSLSCDRFLFPIYLFSHYFFLSWFYNN